MAADNARLRPFGPYLRCFGTDAYETGADGAGGLYPRPALSAGYSECGVAGGFIAGRPVAIYRSCAGVHE